ncbi:hypothetical protein Ancab_007932, partial [Ancistrocladus abbreviatus]
EVVSVRKRRGEFNSPVLHLPLCGADLRTQYWVEFARMAGSSSKEHSEVSFEAREFCFEDARRQITNHVAEWKDALLDKTRDRDLDDPTHIRTTSLKHDTNAILFFDASFYSDGSILSVIARGGELNFLKAAVFSGVAHDPYEVEALACLEAVQMAVTNGWKDVTFIGDYKVVLDSINSETERDKITCRLIFRADGLGSVRLRENFSYGHSHIP